MLKFQIFLVIFCNILLIYGEVNYCNKNLLCKNAKGPHIKCNNNGGFSKKCPADVKLIKLSKEDKEKIVEAHNIKRNQVAGGKLKGFDPAKKMAKIEWSSELEEMAQLNVKTCQFGHDDCRNTPSFPNSGQNLYVWNGYPAPKNAKENFFSAINNWFSEYSDCDMSNINKYGKSKNGKPIGHFTVMVADRNNAVGCAAVTFSEGKFTKIILACNYAFTNMKDQPIYVAGKSASGCKKGVDSKFTALCK